MQAITNCPHATLVMDAPAVATQLPRLGDADAPSGACGCGGH